METIYLDHHATTPCAPAVVAAMLPYFSERFANASSTHAPGRRSREAVEAARARVARLLRGDPREVTFTSGATEANNLALKGVAEAVAPAGGHIVTTVIEHRSVLDVCAGLERRGYEVTYLPVGADGIVSVDALVAALRDETFLVSVQVANNEIGSIQPISDIAAVCKERGVLLHTDAVQALPWQVIDVGELGVDLVSISAHKMYGPKGIGALWARRRQPRVRVTAQLDGGGHERGRRSGTLPVPLIVGFAVACDLARERARDDSERVRRLRDELWRRLASATAGVSLRGSEVHRLPNNLNLAIDGIDVLRLLQRVPHLAASSGSACSSESQEGSYVLRAIGAPDVELGSLRLGLGRETTGEEIRRAAEDLARAVDEQRRSPPPKSLAACADGDGDDTGPRTS